MPGWYIHIPDPTYSGGEFPFGRRLGPYLTEEEAVSQAVSDVAAGFGAVLGVYSEAESEKMRDGSPGKAALSAVEIDALADQERARRDEERKARKALSEPDVSAMWDALDAQITDPALHEIIDALRGRTR